jgi:hypothetical protein
MTPTTTAPCVPLDLRLVLQAPTSARPTLGTTNATAGARPSPRPLRRPSRMRPLAR